jgi:1-deoxy-D-xylulose-5-phosphate synthase
VNNNCPAVLKSGAFFVIIKALFIKRGRSLKDFTEKLTRPALLKASYEELEMLSCEIRSFLIEKISKCGGHLASNLGAVELTIAMHRVFDPNVDRIVFDVGHQTYTHKLLSGRAEGFEKLRKLGGVSGFPKPSESVTDAFIAGHASNSVSVALGMAKARSRLGEKHKIVSVIGDGALTGGLSYEGLSNVVQANEPMLIILNDNGMSISENVGSMAGNLSKLRLSPFYLNIKKEYRDKLRRVKPLYNFVHGAKEKAKDLILPKNIFNDLGLYYLGPVDGHDIRELEYVMNWAKSLDIPVLLHVKTKKGKGCHYAETKPDLYHGVGPFNPENGELEGNGKESFSSVFGDKLLELAKKDKRIVAITAAMSDGTGLSRFSAEFPESLIDVGIAEGHAVSMAAGMAKQGLKPVFAVYSSFLQRAYDMLIHDVSLLGLNVVFAVDRAGIVGEDGETHNGVFDVSYLRSVPGMTVYSPSSYLELGYYLEKALSSDEGPVAVRYPRGSEGDYSELSQKDTDILKEGSDISIASYGTMINEAITAAEILAKEDISAELIKINKVKPLDLEPIKASVSKTKRLIIAEESCAQGSLSQKIITELHGCSEFQHICLNLGEGIIEQGSIEELRSIFGIDAKAIAKRAKGLDDGKNQT